MKISTTAALIITLLLSLFNTDSQAISFSGFGNKNDLLNRNTYVIFAGNKIHIMDLFNEQERCKLKINILQRRDENADTFARRKSRIIAYCKDLKNPVVEIVEPTTLVYHKNDGTFSFELPNIDNGGSGWVPLGQKSILMNFKLQPRSANFKIYADKRYFTGKWRYSKMFMSNAIDVFSHTRGAKQLRELHNTLQTRYIGTLKMYKSGRAENPWYNFDFLLSSIVVYSVTERADILTIDLW